MTTPRRLTPDDRRRVIVTAAVRVMRENETLFPTRSVVAAACEVPTSEATVRHYFPTERDLRIAAGEADEKIQAMITKRGLDHELPEATRE